MLVTNQLFPKPLSKLIAQNTEGKIPNTGLAGSQDLITLVELSDSDQL